MRLKIIILFLSILSTRPTISQTQEEDSLWQMRSEMMDSMAYINAYETIYIYQNDKIIDSIEKNILDIHVENARVKIIEFKKDWSIVDLRNMHYYLGIPGQDTTLTQFQELKSVKIKTEYLLTKIQRLTLYKLPDIKSKKIIDLLESREEWWLYAIQQAKIVDMKLGWYKVEFPFEKKNYSGWIPMDLCCFTLFTSCE